MARRVSREEFVEVASRPKRRFMTLTVSATGKVSLRTARRAPCYWFERHREVVEADGIFTANSDSVTITMLVDGTPSVLF